MGLPNDEEVSLTVASEKEEGTEFDNLFLKIQMKFKFMPSEIKKNRTTEVTVPSERIYLCAPFSQ